MESKSSKFELWAVLEIHHDSDCGPNDVDFDHKITLFRSQADAVLFMKKRVKAVRRSSLAKTNEIFEEGDRLIVFQSDDWYKWELYPVKEPK